MTVYGYARVSTAGQDLEAQVTALEAEGCDELLSEHFTGTITDRPVFTGLLAKLKEGDTLVVTKLDRIARSATQGSELVRELIDQGVRVHILNMGVMDNRPASKLIRNIFFAFAEFERDMIVERTQEGKVIAKQRDDFREGRPRKFSKRQIDHALDLLATYSYTEVERMTGISKATLVRRNRERKAQL
ncbi:recombinase family protein [Bacillus sp. WMMC1349]|uniref:recombinase family protein n=1 Tax=Bacillus sp. WMMC1349 TaxID=2736254 RepID=UPI0015580876|nr:recombinase family protein [Bacillus sp. WMMC1349]NPC94031.1 recombinase family protein [Bacillus sp. WMMC1349]